MKAKTLARLSLLTFRAGTQWYGVNIAHVFEVSNLVAIAPIPDSPPAILGVVNIRGHVVPILDLRIRFNIAERPLHLTTPIIFFHRQETSTYGVVVDDVDDVISVSSDAINPTPLTEQARHIMGIVQYQHRLVTLLEPNLLLRSSLENAPAQPPLSLNEPS
jgi:purine-binding chemotaxis protein CheW